MIPLREADRRFLWSAAFLGLLLFGLVHNAEPQSPPSSDDFKLSVSVDLVELQATVQTPKAAMSRTCASRISRYMKRAFGNPSGCSGTRTFRLLRDK
jgi:hypothetical protein